MQQARRGAASALLRLAAGTVLLALAGGARAQAMTFLIDDFPPFSVDENDRASGPFPEIVLKVCASLKLACELKFHPWRRAQWLAETGRVDGLFVMLRTPAREAQYYFSGPIIQTSYSVFAPRGSALKYQRPDDLRGYTIGVYGPAGTSAAAERVVAQLTPAPQLVLEMDNPTALHKLLAGRYGERGAVIVNTDLCHWILGREHIDDVKWVGEIQKVDYQIALSRKKLSQHQADTFFAALRALIDSGQARAIVEKYGLKPAF